MSIATNIQRIIDAKSNMRTAINSKGGSIASGDTIDTFATAITNLPNDWPNEFKKLIKGENAYLTVPSGVVVREEATKGKKNLKGITFEGNYSRFSSNMFCNSGLEHFVFPNGFTTMDSYMFEGCTDLIDIVMPDTVTNATGYHMCYGCISLTSCTLSNSMTGISPQAFYNCSALTQCNIPTTCKTISDQAFYNCSSLTGITIPDATSSITMQAFYNCASITQINFPAKITSIPPSCCSGCTSLITATINATALTQINTCAFANCSSLTGITIPNTVTSIYDGAFSGCTILDGIFNLSNVTTVGNYAFRNCQNIKSITFANALTQIKTGTCWNCAALTSATIGSSCTAITASAFTNCSSLTNLSLPNGLKTISGASFANCTSLVNLNLPDSVTSLGTSAFSGCTTLSNVHFPTGCTIISYHSFRNCGFTTLTIPNHIQNIYSYAFAENYNLTTLTIGTGCCSLFGGNSEYAFANCTALTSVTINGIQTGRSSYSDRVFSGCTSIKNFSVEFSNACPILATIIRPMTNLEYLYINAVSIGDGAYGNNCLQELTLGDRVTTLSYRAFMNFSALRQVNFSNTPITSVSSEVFAKCSSLQNIILPSTISTLGNYMFADCVSLTSITLPTAATVLPEQIFKGCSSLQTLRIPSNFSSFARNIVSGCTNLTSIICENETPPTINGYTFSGFTKSNCVLYVPSNSVSAYQQSLYWNDFSSVQPIS